MLKGTTCTQSPPFHIQQVAAHTAHAFFQRQVHTTVLPDSDITSSLSACFHSQRYCFYSTTVLGKGLKYQRYLKSRKNVSYSALLSNFKILSADKDLYVLQFPFYSQIIQTGVLRSRNLCYEYLSLLHTSLFSKFSVKDGTYLHYTLAIAFYFVSFLKLINLMINFDINFLNIKNV